MVAGNEETSKNDARTSNDLKVSDISAINAEVETNNVINSCPDIYYFL